MYTIFAAIAALSGALGLVYAALARPRRATAANGTPPDGGAVIVAALAALVVFLVSLLKRGLFSPGQTLGYGFAMGAAAGFWVLLNARDGSGTDDPGGPVRPISGAALVFGVALLLFRGYPNDALVGCALGAAFVAAWVDVLAGWNREHGRLSLRVYALALSAAAAGAWLGTTRFPRLGPGSSADAYWAVPGLILAAGALTFIVLSGGESITRRKALGAGLVSAAVGVVVVAALQWKLLTSLSFVAAVFGPAAVAYIVWALMREDEAPAPGDASRPGAIGVGAALLAVLAAALAFREMAGTGEALTAAAAVLVAAASLRLGQRRFPEAVGGAIVVVIVIMAWMRAFLERAGRPGTLDFQHPYSVFAVTLGALAVFFLVTHAARYRSRGIPFAAGLALVLAAVGGPALMAAVWGERALMALLAGLVVGAGAWICLLTVGPERREEALAAAPHGLFLLAAIVAVQIGPRAAEMDLTRANKVVMVAVAGMLLIVAIVATAVARRREEGGA